MKKEVNYIENYKRVKIYQYNDNKNYTATPYIYSIEDKSLKDLKVKIDKIVNKDIIKFIILD